MAYPIPDVSTDDYNAAQAAKFAQQTQPILASLDDPTAPPVDPTLSPNQQKVSAGKTPSLRDRNLISNQFDYASDQELTPAEAMAACGPTAALAFARYAGRNPTIGEALRLAKQNGWTPSLGMAGPQSEVSLLGQLGVHSQYNAGASPQDVAVEVQAGRPVIVDTPNHYYAIDDFNPQTGLFHVGGSGLALRGGSEWMSWSQIAAHGGGARGSITIQSPSGQPLGLPGPSASASPPAGASPPPAGASAPPASFESYARQALATIDQGVRTIASQPDATSQRASVATTSQEPNFDTFARSLMATLDGGSSPQNASQPRSGAATGTQQAPGVSQAAVPGYNDMAGAVSSPSQPYSSQYGQTAGIQGPPPMQDTGATNGSGGDVPQPDYSSLPGYGGVQPAPGANPLVNIPQAIGQRIGDTAEQYNAAYTPTLPSQPGHGPLARFTPEQLQAQQELAIGAVLGVQGEAPKIVGEAAGPVAAKVGGDLSTLAAKALDTAKGTAEQVAALRPQEAGDAANILLNKFAPEVRPLLTDAATTFNQFAGQRRGVVPDVQALADAATKGLGMSVEDWLKTKPGTAFNQESALALGQTLQKTGADFDSLINDFQSAKLAGTSTAAQEAAIAQKALEFGALAAVRSGSAAEAGRALRSFRQVLDGSGASTEAAIGRAFQRLGTDPAKFADWATAWKVMPAADTVGRYKMLQALSKPALMDKVLAFGMSNMLSSTKTAEIIAGHGSIMIINRPLLTLLRSSPGEAFTDVAAMGHAIGTAWSNAAEAVIEGVGPTTAAAKLRDGTLEVRPEAFPGKSGLIATPTLRLVAGMHEFFRTLSTAGALAVAARREIGITGRSAADLLANPTPSMLRFAAEEAERAVSGGTPSPFAQLLLKGRNLVHEPGIANKATGLMFHALTPFVKIPDYLMRNGAKILTGPLYYPATASVHALRGEGAQALGDARMWAVTSALDYAIYSQAAAGNITGSGPSDPAKRALLAAARDKDGNPIWQAHSVRVGGRWYDYTTLGGPLSVPLAAISSAVEAYRYEGARNPVDPNFAKAVGANTVRSLMDASYIKTIGDLFKSIDQGNPIGGMGSLAANVGERFVPLGGLAAEVARTIDPGVKAPANVAQTIEGRIPGLSRQVPNQIGPYGEPLQQSQDVLSTLSPSKTSTVGAVNPVANEVARLQNTGNPVGVKVFPVTQQERGGTYLGAPQTAEQIRGLQQSMGQNAQRYLASIIARPDYQTLSDKEKAATLDRALATANQQAEGSAVDSGVAATDDKHKAALAWEAVPHYEGISATGTPQQIQDANLAIDRAKAMQAAYTKRYGNADLGEYHLMKDDKQAWALAQRSRLDSAYLKAKYTKIDQQYGGALGAAAQEGLIDAGGVLAPVRSGR